MSSSEFLLPDIAGVKTNAPASQAHNTSGEGQKHPPSPLHQEQYPKLVEKPKLSPTIFTQSTGYSVPSPTATAPITTGYIEHDTAEDSLLDSDMTDTSCQSKSSKDSFHHATEDTSLMAEEEEDHPHMDIWHDGFAAGTEDPLNRDWDLAHIGSFVHDEAITQALLAAPEEVLDVVAARLEKTLIEAETVLSQLKSVFNDLGHSLS